MSAKKLPKDPVSLALVLSTAYVRQRANQDKNHPDAVRFAIEAVDLECTVDAAHIIGARLREIYSRIGFFVGLFDSDSEEGK